MDFHIYKFVVLASVVSALACVDTDASLESLEPQVIGTVRYRGEDAYAFERAGLLLQAAVRPFVFAHGIIIQEFELAPQGSTTEVEYSLTALPEFDFHLSATFVDASTFNFDSVLPLDRPFGGFPDVCAFETTTIRVAPDDLVEANIDVFDFDDPSRACDGVCPIEGRASLVFNVFSEILEPQENDGFFVALLVPPSAVPVAATSENFVAGATFPLDPAPDLVNVDLSGGNAFIVAFCYDSGADFGTTRSCERAGDIAVRTEAPITLEPDSITQIDVDLDLSTMTPIDLDPTSLGCE